MAEQTFEQQVAAAATEEKIPDVPVMTPEEEAIPTEDTIAIQAEEPVVAPVKAEPEPEKPTPPQTVPLAVHIRQREKLERELNNLKQQTEIGNQRLQQLTEILSPAPQPVDRNTDPLGATLQEMDSLRGDIKETKEMLQKEQQAKQQRDTIAAFQNAVVTDEQSFIQQAPDYPEAVNFAKRQMYNEYLALGLDNQQAIARVHQDAFALAQHAFQQGTSPSELAYKLAVTRGYQRQNAAKQQYDEIATAPIKTQAEKAVEMRSAGAQRSKTTGGAATTGGAMTFAELAALDNEEFAKMTAGKKWDKLFRGA